MCVSIMPRTTNAARCTTCVNCVKTNKLVLLTLIGVCIGLLTGFLLRHQSLNRTAILWLGIPGELYLRLLKLMIVPLIVTAILSVTASMDPKLNGRISVMSVAFMIIVNLVSSILGCLMCILIRPGHDIKFVGTQTETSLQEQKSDPNDMFADLLRNIFPDNMMQATFQQTQTKYRNTSIINSTRYIEDVQAYLGTSQSPNIIGLVIISVLFGTAAAAVKEKGQHFRKFFESATDVVLKALIWIMWTTPIGVASLIATVISTTDDISEDFRMLAFYILTMIVGLLTCVLIIMPVVFFAFRRSNPFRFLLSISGPIMLTLATASTPMTLPQLMPILENENGVDKRISRFVTPFAVTLVRCGSALYISVSTIFVMQMVGTTVDVATVCLVCVLTTFMAMAVPAVHSASLMTVIMLLTALNIPAEAVVLLYTFDWFLDRARSVTNLVYQALCGIVVQELCSSALDNSSIIQNNSELDKLNDDITIVVESIPTI